MQVALALRGITRSSFEGIKDTGLRCSQSVMLD